LSSADRTSIALINHAVKEALDSMQLKHMTHMMGSSDSPPARALLAHAREMDSESRQALQGLLGARAGGVGRTGAGTAGAGSSRGADDQLSGRAGNRTLDGAGGAVDRASRGTGAAGLSGDAGGPVQALAQQARELIQVIQEISGGGDALGEDRGGAGGSAGDRGASGQGDRRR